MSTKMSSTGRLSKLVRVCVFLWCFVSIRRKRCLGCTSHIEMNLDYSYVGLHILCACTAPFDCDRFPAVRHGLIPFGLGKDIVDALVFGAVVVPQ